MKLKSFAEGHWVEGEGPGRRLYHAVTGEEVAEVTSRGLDFKRLRDYGRQSGGSPLRQMTFHQRALMLKDLAKYLLGRKKELYRLSAKTGATRTDSWIDIEGGISTLFVYSSKGRRELPDESFHVEGDLEALSRKGSFVGQHICVPLEGVAVHINAFNFPCWGMLEKLSATWLAGMPAIVKPATISSFVAEGLARQIVESGLLPAGAFQLVCGSVGDLLDHLDFQDVVTFTGSAATGEKIKRRPNLLNNAVRFNRETDSLNCSILGSDVEPGAPEFDLFLTEVAREMTVKAGQKCTAIRRALVPLERTEAVVEGLKKKLKEIRLGDPANKEVGMGPLAARGQVDEVKERVGQLAQVAEFIHGDPEKFEVIDGDADKGAFLPSLLLHCEQPLRHNAVHDIEAFGPVSTIMPYQSIDEAVELARRGQGSLVGSLFTADDRLARRVVHGLAPYHGRLLIANAESGRESTGHGSPLPHLVHGGPGRAGGGEEMGGIRALHHYLQRTALQGSPTTLSQVCNRWFRGSQCREDRIHPFRKYFEELEPGESLTTHARTITETDVVNFGCLSGDHFYAHLDDVAARASFFEKRVAHGYLILSVAAGLFVDPAPGPVMANYGLDRLRFTQPVYIGDTIRARLTCQQKTRKPPREDQVPQGVVAWDVEVTNQEAELVATYTILTLVRCREES